MNDAQTETKFQFEPTTVAEIVRGLDPIDWVDLRLAARLTPAQRVLAGMSAQAFAMAALRGTFRKRFPELSLAELNMRVLRYVTSVQMGEI
ncbi:MAG: hypothetical protein HZC40_25940 [Chloroflexi bacterium]|nr:hypothetical protein [Chloroflexota bacterium]